MQDELRDRIVRYISTNRTCVIATCDSANVFAIPARCRLVAVPNHPQTLQVDCLLPEWALLNYHLAQGPRVTLIFLHLSADRLSWLQYQGTVLTMVETGWDDRIRLDDGYGVIRVTPSRIDLIDENRGWGVRETWEK